ncbi:MAG: PGF-CTERM sorting domain-containing protein, partial [Halohasta sp.]
AFRVSGSSVDDVDSVLVEEGAISDEAPEEDEEEEDTEEEDTEEDTEEEEDSSEEEEDSTDDETPGFGALVALVALIGAALLAARRQN